MLNFPRWAVLAILAPLLIGIACAVPSFLPDRVVEQLPKFMQTRVNLGLDLSGGSHLLLEASTQDVAKQRLANMEEQVRTELRRGDTKIAIGDISSRDGKLSFMVRNPSEVDAAVERIRPLTQGAGLTGQRDFNVEVVNSSTIVITPTQAGWPASYSPFEVHLPRGVARSPLSSCCCVSSCALACSPWSAGEARGVSARRADMR